MNVPHFYQTDEQNCGAACVRMLCAALGKSYDEATLARYCNVTPLGCTVNDLVAGAQLAGLAAQVLPIPGEASARAALSNDVPFVAMIELTNLYGAGSMFLWHFVVPLELASDMVSFRDPGDGPDRRVPVDVFLSAWGTAGYRGVRVWIP
jgi:ABC-type bacteriocin/lantibiotic exporter with double-glycine peptidase domain